MEQKTLLILINRECGFGLAAELCNHLIAMQQHRKDDQFWDNVSNHERGKIIALAKSHGHKKLGAFDLMQFA